MEPFENLIGSFYIKNEQMLEGKENVREDERRRRTSEDGVEEAYHDHKKSYVHSEMLLLACILLEL